MSQFTLPVGHDWVERPGMETGSGAEWAYECRCGAFFYACHDQGRTTTQYEAGDGHEQLRRYRVQVQTTLHEVLWFHCDAEDMLHAEEQALDAYPGADIIDSFPAEEA